jgi:hypothetical protein
VQSVEIRPFRQGDREQLTGLVNAHIAAVIPGIVVSVNTVMSQLEREPGEAVVDPWVIERETLVAVQRDAIVAAAHLHRFGDGVDVSESASATTPCGSGCGGCRLSIRAGATGSSGAPSAMRAVR